MPTSKRTLFLCGGLQSSGSTLVSWCFLQRPDLDGYLDADNDVLAELPKQFETPALWYKTTIGTFRMSEMIEHYRDDGWDVRPLLICRDVCVVWTSLAQKPYGINGTTAEDPPLRLRMRRFKSDWELFQQQRWPVLTFEHFQADPERTLRNVCQQLQLPWDDSMLSWPKPREAIMNTRHGNATFRDSCSKGLLASLRPTGPTYAALTIPPADLAWLEKEFAQFNQVQGYPVRTESALQIPAVQDRAVPTFDKTRRQKWIMRQAPMRYILFKLGLREAVAAVR